MYFYSLYIHMYIYINLGLQTHGSLSPLFHLHSPNGCWSRACVAFAQGNAGRRHARDAWAPVTTCRRSKGVPGVWQPLYLPDSWMVTAAEAATDGRWQHDAAVGSLGSRPDSKHSRTEPLVFDRSMVSRPMERWIDRWIDAWSER